MKKLLVAIFVIATPVASQAAPPCPPDACALDTIVFVTAACQGTTRTPIPGSPNQVRVCSTAGMLPPTTPAYIAGCRDCGGKCKAEWGKYWRKSQSCQILCYTANTSGGYESGYYDERREDSKGDKDWFEKIVPGTGSTYDPTKHPLPIWGG